MRYSFIHAEKAIHSIVTMCRLLRVSTSGYYEWLGRGPSEREQENRKLSVHIKAVHEASGCTYGSPRILLELHELGFKAGVNRIARLMHEMGLKATVPRRFRRSESTEHGLPVAPNVVERDFDPERPNQLWATDITYIWTWQGWLYLAVVVDLFSRRVVGWAVAEHMRTELVLEALQMALQLRVPGDDLVHHSDRGSQYASNQYQVRLQRHGITCSMSRKGDCWDNAVVESFFATLKKDLLYRHPWPTRSGARESIGRYVEGFYNPRRRHSYLGQLSPAEYERRYALRATQAA
jgi:transposase InsO family protein